MGGGAENSPEKFGNCTSNFNLLIKKLSGDRWVETFSGRENGEWGMTFLLFLSEGTSRDQVHVMINFKHSVKYYRVIDILLSRSTKFLRI